MPKYCYIVAVGWLKMIIDNGNIVKTSVKGYIMI